MAKKNVEIILQRAVVLAHGEIGVPRAEPYLVAEDVAADLVQRGRARLVNEIDDVSDGDAEYDALIDSICSAVRMLKPGDFGSDGKPKLDPIRKLLPQDARRVTAEARDDAWQDLQDEGFEAPGEA